ncbi:E3 ubiquitin-protein ligase UPL5-like [Cajanus cajan]|uniref:E3 ubiquitin-protein ligase UPL5-like n=1 Tax=Cajanus cajan TaxID=3821 RepID=UPI00098DB227|nr:E3 ubiquitin-protein ligase UPL5-like [Cajanus cajan]
MQESKLLAESFEYIGRAEPETLRSGLFMEFKNEQATGPGVTREWFVLVCHEIFNPQNALFVACPNDCRRFYPNPASKVHPRHLEYFRFAGRIIALALMKKVQVGIVFDRVFFMQLAGNNVILEDIRDADPFLYRSCKLILEMHADFIDSDALGLTFVREVEVLGCRKVVELCPDGKSLVVNSLSYFISLISAMRHPERELYASLTLDATQLMFDVAKVEAIRPRTWYGKAPLPNPISSKKSLFELGMII